jgi:hypothetical protein
LHVGVMGTLDEAEKVEVPADQVGGRGQHLEIGSAQGGRLIRERKRLEGVAPGAMPVRLTALFECVEHACGHCLQYAPSSNSPHSEAQNHRGGASARARGLTALGGYCGSNGVDHELCKRIW